MEGAGIGRAMISRVKGIHKETRCRVKIGDRLSEKFWTDLGVRQGCPLSPTLFNIYISDFENTMRRGQDGDVVVGNEKIWSLGYADDIVLMAESQRELELMMERPARYFERKKLVVNVEKTKVMACSKGGGRREVPSWEWGGRKLEEVKTMDYLGYRVMRTGGQSEHVKERVRKAVVAIPS